MLKLVVIGLGLYTFGSLGFFSQLISLSDILTINIHVSIISYPCDYDGFELLLEYYSCIVFSQASCAFAEIGFKKFIDHCAISSSTERNVVCLCVWFQCNLPCNWIIYTHPLPSFVSHTFRCGFYFYLTQTLFFIVLLILFSYLSYC